MALLIRAAYDRLGLESKGVSYSEYAEDPWSVLRRLSASENTRNENDDTGNSRG